MVTLHMPGILVKGTNIASILCHSENLNPILAVVLI